MAALLNHINLLINRIYINENGNMDTKPELQEVNGFYPSPFGSIQDFHDSYPRPVDRFFYYIKVGDPYIALQYIDQIRNNIDKQAAIIIFRYETDIPLARVNMPDTLFGYLEDNQKEISSVVLIYSIMYNLPHIFIRLFPTINMTDWLLADIDNALTIKEKRNEAPIEIINYLVNQGVFRLADSN